MNVAELERLVAGADDPWQPACMATLNAMSVRLARRVIAAEKLVEALRYYDLGEYAEECLEEYEATK